MVNKREHLKYHVMFPADLTRFHIYLTIAHLSPKGIYQFTTGFAVKFRTLFHLHELDACKIYNSY